MTEAIGAVLAPAVGVLLSPAPVIAVILVLFSPRARTNGPAFLLGWVLGLTIVVSVVYATSSGAEAATDSTTGDTISWGKVAVGLLLLVGAARQWRSRPAPGEATDLPKWMSALDGMTPVKAAALAALLSGLNPKNLALSAVAAASVAQTGASGADAVVALVLFVVVASLSIAVPVGYALFGGEGARTTLDSWRAWLEANNAAVMAVVLLVFGAKLLGDGLTVL